jgi:hypothetical protein
MRSFLSESTVFTTGAAILERVLDLDIHGRLSATGIDDKVIEVAKAT